MSTTWKYFIGLGIIVIGFYLGLTYLPQLVGTCMDGECGFSVGEIVISCAIPLAFIALPIVMEMVLYRKGLSQAMSDIGITRFSWGGAGTMMIYLLPLIAFFPVFSLLTGAEVTLRAHWPWLLLNIILVNGPAEEIMMRGFVFRHLRERRPFWRAATLATVYFAVYHLPIIVSSGAVIGIMAVIMAMPLGFLTAYVYERSNSTIWWPTVLHVVNNALVMLFVVPADLQPSASSLYLLIGIVVSTLILARTYRAGYGRTDAQPRTQAVAVTA